MLIQEEEPQNARRMEHNVKENGKKPGMLLSILQCIGKSPTIKIFYAKLSVVPKLRKTWSQIYKRQGWLY